MTRPGIELRFPGPLANTLNIMPMVYGTLKNTCSVGGAKNMLFASPVAG